MRHLVMRFRGILRGHNADKLDARRLFGVRCVRAFAADRNAAIG
jgi:hypothetical protein